MRRRLHVLEGDLAHDVLVVHELADTSEKAESGFAFGLSSYFLH
jgi:hypothetical protein